MPIANSAAIKDTAPAIAATRFDHFIFIVVTLLYWTNMYIYVPILPSYMQESGYSAMLIGIVLGSYGFTQMLIRFPLGLLSDKLQKRKPFLMIGMLSGALSCFLFTIPDSWLWPLAGRMLSGVCASAWVAFTVLYAAYYASSEATKAMSNISFLTVGGQLTGMTLSGWLSDMLDWNAAFIAGIVIGLTGFVLVLAVREPREGVAREPISVRHLGDVVRTPSLIRVSLLSILGHSVLFITMFGFTPLKATGLGADNGQLTIIVIAFMIPHAIASLMAGRWLAPRFGAWNITALGFALSAICTIAMAYSQSLTMLIATQAVNGFAQGLYIALLLGMAIQPFELNKRATAMGFYQAAYAIGMFAGPFLAGFMNEEFGLDSGFWLGGMFALAALLLTWRWKERAS